MSFWCLSFDQNSNENIARISALKVFIASLGLPVSFFGFKSFQEATKKFRAEILTIFSLLFWSKRWHQKDILKLLTFKWEFFNNFCFLGISWKHWQLLPDAFDLKLLHSFNVLHLIMSNSLFFNKLLSAGSTFRISTLTTSKQP